MSERPSSSSPRTCSGDMYSGVPAITGTARCSPLVAASRETIVASPKSHTFTRSTSFPSSSRDAVMTTFSGLMSRWTMPTSDAAESAAQTWQEMSSARSSGIRPCQRSARSSVPTSSSIAM